MNTFEKGFQSFDENTEDHTDLFEKLEAWYDDNQSHTPGELSVGDSTAVEEA